MPSALGCYVEATATLAGQAVERGDMAEARRLLEAALRALGEAEGRLPVLRAVVGDGLAS